MRRALVGVLIAAALPAAAQNINDPREAQTGGKTDWERAEEERNFKEGELALPAAPRPENLVEFFPSAATRFRFFIDAASLSVEDGLIRWARLYYDSASLMRQLGLLE